MEIDHLFICSENNADIADILVQNGFLEGKPNHHPGQGTANRRFFFNNMFLEFIYLEDKGLIPQFAKATPSLDILLRLTDQERRYSPFGVGCRPRIPGESVPFPHWCYQPSYLPDGCSIEVGIAMPNEPLWFFLAFSGRPDQVAVGKRQPLNHPCGIRELTGVQLTIPNRVPLSLSAQAVGEIDEIEIMQGQEHGVVLTFDFYQQGKKVSLMPGLPLTIFY